MTTPVEAAPKGHGWRLGPAFGPLLALLPKATCPLCVAAYAGFVSSLGLGFLLTKRILVPVIALSLVLSIGSVAWTCSRLGKAGPVVAAVAGAALVAIGRFWLDAPPLLFVGVACLVGASLWTLWLQRKRTLHLVRLD